mmetsp:Transcript_39356/g.59467  ORF Transcript_39356/g.59467 Transcript_39356/m.59467 type:complete len:310 (-) Transcript_39356:306-1235(-)
MSKNDENVSITTKDYEASIHTSSSPSISPLSPPSSEIVRKDVKKEIIRQVIRQKLSKMRHLVLPEVISPDYLDSLFPKLLELFDPQTVEYNGGIAKVKQWKISCYLEVMEGGIPCTNPNMPLLNLFTPLLHQCNDLFTSWYKQQHSYEIRPNVHDIKVKRIMTFITRYRPNPGENALLKHVDGAGKVDGSVVVALPVDRWSDTEEANSFVGHGGGLTFWDGKESVVEEEEKEGKIEEEKKEGDTPFGGKLGCRRQYRPKEIQYDTRSGDVAFIDRAVWHQANPISKGTRWALVIFYDVTKVLVDQKEGI